MHYWDTSALVKLYVKESDSPQFAAHVASNYPLTTSELARFEFFRVLARKEAEGLISPGAAEIVFKKFLADISAGAITILPINEAVESKFRQIIIQLHHITPPLLVRTMDGIHIASADHHTATRFVATDSNMRKCAAALGLTLFP